LGLYSHLYGLYASCAHDSRTSGFLLHTPGLGAATAAVISMQITRKLGDHGFMVLMGSINTVNFVLSIATLYVLDKARNGSIIAVKELVDATSIPIIIVYLASTLVAGSIAVYLTLKISLVFCKIVSVVNYRKLLISIIVLITLLVVILTGPLGMIVLITSTAIGLLPAIKKTSRTHGMGCLLVPVMIYFL